MRAMALPPPPAPTRRMRMRNILDLVTATHWTSRHVCLSQLKSLRNEQIDARTVASRVREAHELATADPAWEEQNRSRGPRACGTGGVTAGTGRAAAGPDGGRAGGEGLQQGGGGRATEQTPGERRVERALKPGASGLVPPTITAPASVAPAYSIAATLVFVVGFAALQSPAVAVLAFVPM